MNITNNKILSSLNSENLDSDNVPRLRFPEFTGEWKRKKLGEVAEVTAGGTPSTLNKQYWNGNIRWMNSGELNLKKIYEVENKITDFGLKNSSTKILPKYCIMIGLAGQGKTRGTVAMNMVELCTNQSIGSILPNESYVPEYLYQNLDNRYDELRGLSTGDGGRGGLNLSIIKSFSVFFPTLSEQTKIAAFLTAVDEKIQALKKKKEKLQLYKKGVMQQLFSQELRFKNENGENFSDWEVKKLGEVCEIQGGYAFKSNLFNQGKTKVIRIGDIDSIIELNKFSGAISNEIPDNKYQVKKNDFLMALSGATFGKVGKIVDNGIGYINQRVALFKTKQYLEYFYQLVQTDEFKNYINSIPTASAQPNISNSDILNYITEIPPLPEQTKIANFLSVIDEKINYITTQIEKTQVWKKGLLQKMFV